jgi:hypothetical protein
MAEPVLIKCILCDVLDKMKYSFPVKACYPPREGEYIRTTDGKETFKVKRIVHTQPEGTYPPCLEIELSKTT